mmetsp:Transcript_44738/g.103472  ORF Transcript_44738/g.103472 Transcript_44738/m.103472 type:complete len:714 (-) Transcript_44738:61-2202(-)
MPPRANPELETLKERVATLEVRLQSELTAMQESVARTQTSEIHLATSGISERLEKTSSELSTKVGALAESMSAAEALVQRVVEETTAEKITDIATRALGSSLGPLQQAVDTCMLRTEGEEFQKSIANIMQPLEQRVAEVEALCGSISQSRSESSLQESMAEEDAGADEPDAAPQPGLEVEIQRLDELILQNKNLAEAGAAELSTALESRMASLEKHLQEQNIEDLEKAATKLLAAQESLDVKASKAIELEHRLSERIDNMYARVFTWRIRGFREKLSRIMMDALDGKERSLLSPEFSLCAQPDMRLELQAANDSMQDKKLTTPLKPRVPSPGACNLCLWARPGLALTFRFKLGTGSSAVSRRFEYRFTGGDGTALDSEGRECFLIKNFCVLDNAWDKATNTLPVLFELLEMQVRTDSGAKEDVPAPLSSEGAPATAQASQEPDTEESLTDMAGLAAAMLRQHVHDPRTVVDEREKLDDAISFTHLASSEALIMERFRDDLQAVRNRAVRRVEWRVQGVARLLDLSKAGEALDSPPFAAAGIDSLRFHFYPRGHDRENQNHSQPCALYLSAPAGVTVRGTLFVGSTSRGFEQQYRYSGEFGGRGRFCSLESQHDCQDAVTLAVEIAEAEAQLPDSSFNLCIRQASAATEASTTSKSNESASMVLPLKGAKGSMRMTRKDPSGTEDLLRTVSLPTMHTQKFYLPHLQSKTVGVAR